MPIDVAALIFTPMLVLTLVSLAQTDLRERRLPDRLTFPLIAMGLAFSAWRVGGVPTQELIGAGCGFLLFWALGEAHFRLRRAEGLGLGDAKLIAAAGAWLGWRDLPLLVLFAAIGALAAVAAGRLHQREIAFGPWLAAAFLLLWLDRLFLGVGR